MSKLEASMALLMKTFDTYAKGKESLSKAEAKTLLEKELPELLKAAKNQEEVDKLLNGLDLDRDSEVDFTEFMLLVTALTCACHNRFPKK